MVDPNFPGRAAWLRRVGWCVAKTSQGKPGA